MERPDPAFDRSHKGEFLTLRHCPQCEHQMVTTGLGRFWCEPCGYEDRQDVEALKAKGLDYPWWNGIDKTFALRREE